MKSSFTKINVLLVLIVLAMSLCLFGCNQNDTKVEVKALAISSEAVACSDASAIETLQVTATVTPADAVDKSVDWTLAWASGASRASEPVTDYVTVTPETDGALTAMVSCYQSFLGDTINLTVTARAISGVSSTQQIKFIGNPTTLQGVVTGGIDIVETDTIGLALNRPVTVAINGFDNIYHSVSAEYSPYWEVYVSARGRYNCIRTFYDENGDEIEDQTTIDAYTEAFGGGVLLGNLSDCFDGTEPITYKFTGTGENILDYILVDLFDFSYSNNAFSINYKSEFSTLTISEDLYFMGNTNGASYIDSFNQNGISQKGVYFTFIFRDSRTGLEKSVCFKLIEETSVSATPVSFGA